MRLRRLVSSFLALLLALPVIGASQSVSRNDWSALQVVRFADRLDVRLKNGEKVDGDFNFLTDTALTISRGKKTIIVTRTDVLSIHRLAPKHVGKSSAVGAAVGAAAGAVLGVVTGEDCSNTHNWFCISRPAAAALGAIVFAIPGAITGLVVGLAHRNRELIYET